MNYTTPKQKPDLDDLVFNVCLATGLLAIIIEMWCYLS